MTELGINGGDGLKKPHPALLDPEVRKAIGHAIDKKTIVNRVLDGLGKPLETLSVSPNPAWTPDIPEADRFDFDLDKAKQILEDAGYKDTDGDGVREMPGGGEPLNFRYAVRTDSEAGPPTAEFITGWLKEIGIATTRKVYDDSALTVDHRQGRLRPLRVGLGAVRGPGPDAVVLHNATRSRAIPKDPTNYYNDANYCDPEYDKLYEQQKVELDADEARADRPRDAHAPSAVGRVPHAVHVSGHPGVPEGPLRGLRPAAGQDRARVLLEHVAVIRADEAGVGVGLRGRRRQ